MGTQENKDSAVRKQVGLRRMAFAEELANVLIFLLSDGSSYMNGGLLLNVRASRHQIIWLEHCVCKAEGLRGGWM